MGVISSTMREDFLRDGFLVLSPGISSEHLNWGLRLFNAAFSTSQLPLTIRSGWDIKTDDPEILKGLHEFCASSGIHRIAQELVRPDLTILPPGVPQLLSTIPACDHDYRPHFDTAPIGDGVDRPPFSLLAGVWLTDFSVPGRGNLVVWPGSHITCAELFAHRGPATALAEPREDGLGLYPAGVDLGEPVELTGEAGGIVLIHHLLAHTSGNISGLVRQAIHYRLYTDQIAHSRTEVMIDPFHEFARN